METQINSKVTFPEIGVPQGSIISPLLSNLILDKMDKFIETLKSKYDEKSDQKKHYVTNPDHVKLSGRIRNITLKIDRWKKKGLCTKILNAEKRILLRSRMDIKSTCPNPEFSRIEYVRYADD